MIISKAPDKPEIQSEPDKIESRMKEEDEEIHNPAKEEKTKVKIEEPAEETHENANSEEND